MNQTMLFRSRAASTFKRCILGVLALAAALGVGTAREGAAQTKTTAKPAGEIVVAIRYLMPTGVSHAHLFLYRDDGKLLRQLTRDDSGQDMCPVFAPDGETIVFMREKGANLREFWQVAPRGTGLKRLSTAPDWYKPAQNREASAYTSPYFSNAEVPSAAQTGGAKQADAVPRYQAPDGSVELELKEVKGDPDNDIDGPGHGAHFLLRDLKTKRETELGKLPGFNGVYDLLHDKQTGKQAFLIEDGLHVAFFGLHLDSTAGDTVYALDLRKPRLVQLSPNWAAPFPLPGESAFLTLTEVRYVPLTGSKKSANSSYVERWDSGLHKVRFARSGVAALCYGASLYRPGRTPVVVTIPKFDN